MFAEPIHGDYLIGEKKPIKAMMRMWAGLMLPSWSSSVPSIQGWSPGQANRTRSAISGLGYSMT